MTAAAPAIDPVLILSTGRYGSTMVSEMLNRHPAILSLSEFFVVLGPEAFALERPDGDDMWRLYTRQSAALHAMLKDGQVAEECLYAHDAPGARYRPAEMPPIIITTLPHLTDRPEALLDELEPVVRSQPRMHLADHYRALFAHLAARFGRRVWVERSGGSLGLAPKLLRLFAEARVVHVFRDGRDTAISMSRHHNFRVAVAAHAALRRLGLDPVRLLRAPHGSRLEVWGQRLLFALIDTGRIAERPPDLAAFGAFWSRLIELGEEVLGGLPAGRVLKLRFEDVQQAPRQELGRLIAFIDPSLAHDAWLEEAAAMVRPTRSSRDRLPPAEREALARACAPGLALLGYEP
ncbi:MAG: sulfotransferase [Thalassobaculales bacterium]